jgi:hypothetical protein
VADQVRLVATRVEIPVADLPIVMRAYRIVSLADMHGHMDIFGKVFDRKIHRLDRRNHFFVARWSQIRFVNLDVFAPRFDKPLKILVQKFCCIEHHLRLVVIVLIERYRRQEMRPCHGDFDGLTREGRHVLEFIDKAEIY